MSTWYYASGDDRKGPVSSQTLNELVAEGTVRDDTLVWREGMADWQRWSEVRVDAGFAEAPAAGSAPEDDGREVCAVSGLRLPRERMVQVGDQWVSVEHRDDYFQKLREGGNVGQELRPARILSRIAARFIDGFILFLLFFVPLMFFAAVGAFDPESTGGVELGVGILQWVIPAIYTAFFLSRFGATPGKMAVRIKVVRPDGGPISGGRALGRHFGDMLSGMLLGIGYLIALGDKERRTLHDRICDTRVVERDD